MQRFTIAAFMACLIVLAAQAARAQEDNEAGAELDKTEEASVPSNVAGDGNSIIQLQPVLVTATRQRRALVDTPANISIITEDDLDRRMDDVIDEIFRYEAGIEVPRQTSGANPFSSSGGIEIRGVGGNRTQVLVDGNRTIESITDSTRDVIDASNIKAVEIVRGPASVLWGSDALGGVVNFVTKDPGDYLQDGRRFAGNFNFSYGTVDNAFTESLTLAFAIAPEWEALISYTRRDANEIKLRKARIGEGALQDCPRDPAATPCNRFDPADIASNNLLAKLVWKPNRDHRVRLTGEYFERQTDVSQNSTIGPVTSFFGTVTAFQDSYDWQQDIKRWRFSIDHEWTPDGLFFDALKWQFTYSPQDVDRNGDRRRTLLPSGDQEQVLRDQDYEELFIEGDVQFTSSFSLGGTDHVLTYGFDGDRTETDFNRLDITRNLTQGTETIRRAAGFNFADATTTRADGYIQDEISMFDGVLKLIPGVRIAHYAINPKPDGDYQLVPGAEPRKITRTNTQFKVGAIVELTERFSVYARFAEGFKMPTAQQLFQSVDNLPFFALIPNPNLKPESVNSYEAGLRGDFGSRGYFSINGFFADYTDFILNFEPIDPVQFGLPPGSQTLTYENVDSVKIYGIEASAAFIINDVLSANAALSWQDGTRRQDGVKSEFLGALPFQAVLGVRYNNETLGLDIELVGTFQAGGAKVNDPSDEFSPGGYVTFDLITSYEIVHDVFIRFDVYNIFDKRYFPADARGFPFNDIPDNVKRVNPIELQTAPGRNFKFGVSAKF